MAKRTLSTKKSKTPAATKKSPPQKRPAKSSSRPKPSPRGKSRQEPQATLPAEKSFSLQSMYRVLESLPGGILHVDGRGRVLWANGLAHAMARDLDLNLERLDVFSLSFPLILENGEHSNWRDTFFIQCSREGKPHPPIVFGLKGTDGSLIWREFLTLPLAKEGDSQDSAAGSLIMVFDITPRMMTHKNALQSAERFRAFTEHFPFIAFLKDDQARFLYLNAAGRANYPFKEPLGKTALEYLPPEMASLAYQDDLNILRTGEAKQSVESFPSPEGETHEWLVSKFPVIDSDGTRYLGGVAIDLTERIQEERLLQQARAELEQRVDERTAGLEQANALLQREVEQRLKIDAALVGEQQLLKRMIDFHEGERQLVAYEIHDGIVQYVTAALMHLEAFAVTCSTPAHNNLNYRECLRLLRNAIDESRRMIGGLRPPILDEEGIVAAIEYLIAEGQATPHVVFEHPESMPRLPSIVESALFRICQEALTNARKHSRGKNVNIRLLLTSDHIVLEVEDDGIGFDPAHATQRNFGLQGIRERSRLLGGTHTIHSEPNKGTKVRVELPLK